MRIFRVAFISVLASLLGIGIGSLISDLTGFRHRTKAPTTRYHGYELNRQAIEKAKAFTVLISNESWEGGMRGTGVVYDSRHVLTCNHMAHDFESVIDLPDEFWVFLDSGTTVLRGKSVYESKKDDLMILELSQPVSLPAYAVFQENHYLGEPITIIGNTMGRMIWFVSYGIVSSDDGPFILTDGLIKGGNSGGPWINEGGEVLAITDWGLEGDEVRLDISGGVSATVVNRFIANYRKSLVHKELPSDMNVLFGVINDGTIKIHGKR
jgi:S1-C subfamily serine protease